MTLFPLVVTVYSGWVICSRIQIELLSKTLVSFIDWASCGLAKIKSPPRTGLPFDVDELLEDALAPHPASSARALPAIRTLASGVRYITSTSGGFGGTSRRRQRPPRWRQLRSARSSGAPVLAWACTYRCTTQTFVQTNLRAAPLGCQ